MCAHCQLRQQPRLCGAQLARIVDGLDGIVPRLLSAVLLPGPGHPPVHLRTSCKFIENSNQFELCPFELFDVVASEDTLRNVIRSVTRNWQSIILTGLLALILVYHFSIIGYLFFQRGLFPKDLSNRRCFRADLDLNHGYTNSNIVSKEMFCNQIFLSCFFSHCARNVHYSLIMLLLLLYQ